MTNQSVKSIVVAFLVKSGFEAGGFFPARQEKTHVAPRSIWARLWGHKTEQVVNHTQSATHRERLHRGRWFVTVGEFTTSFYTQMGDTGRGGAQTFATWDFKGIEGFVATILSEEVKGS